MKITKESLELLKDVRELLRDPGSWTGVAYATDSAGYHCNWDDKRAIKFSTTGALLKLTNSESEYIEAVTAICGVLNTLPRCAGASIDYFDKYIADHNDVIEVLDLAIRRTEYE